MTDIFKIEDKVIIEPALGENVAVRTPNGSVMLKLMKLVREEKTDDVALLLASNCVIVDGAPIGERIEQLNAPAFMAAIKLATSEVMPLTGVASAGE